MKNLSDAFSEVMSDNPVWSSAKQFAEWYLLKGMPFGKPSKFFVAAIEGLFTYPVFQHKNFQAEMCLGNAKKHVHPFVDTFCLSFVGGNWVADAEDAQAMIVFQMFPDGISPSPIYAVWQGKTLGEKHEGLIKTHFKNAVIQDGFADIAKKA